MKAFSILVLFTLTLGQAWAQKPFKNALIFPGGGFKTGMHLASYHALISSGIQPDLLIGTCGGSITAAIIEKFPTSPEAQLDFLLSREVHRKLLDVQPTKYGRTFKTLETFLLSKTTRKIKNESFLKRYLLNVPQDLAIFGTNRFTPVSSLKPFSTIIQSVEYTDKSEAKPFQQVYFTDEKTGTYLADYTSSITKLFKESRLKDTTRVISDFDLDQAVRSSISDPYLMEPYKKDDKLFMTGAIDVLPLDMAGSLATNTFYLYENTMPKMLDALFEETFGSSMLEKLAIERPADQSLMKDSDVGQFNMDPAFAIESGIDTQIPKDYEAYKEKMKGQYLAAFKRSTSVLQGMKSQTKISN